MSGQIVESANGRVVVEWDNSTRVAMGLGEALMTLMPEPRAERPKIGSVSYELPGFDSESVAVMCRLGVDPVNVSGLASHFAPSSDSQGGWRDALVSALRGLGLRAKQVSGMAPNASGELGTKSWIEARLPLGNRLVVDVSPSRMVIRAGPVDEYVLMPSSRTPFTRLSPEIE
jgi:hypothetical protein